MGKLGTAGAFLILALLIIGIGYACVSIFNMYYTTYEITGTVQDKHIDYSSNGSHYVVSLTSGQQLEIQRQPWTWDASANPDRIYASISKDQSYTFTCWGWENEMFYWYPNVIGAVEINNQP